MKVEDYMKLLNEDGSKPEIRLDPNVVQPVRRSPAESFMPMTADPYVISKYNEYDHETRDSLIQEISDLVSEGKSKAKACEEAVFNDRRMDTKTLRFWMRQVPEYDKWIKEAEEDRRERLFDEIVDIPDRLIEELVENEHFASIEERIKIASLRVKARQHLTSKVDPIKFGGKQEANKGEGVIIVWNEERTEKDNSVPLEEILRRNRENRDRLIRDRKEKQIIEDDDTGAEEVE